MAVQRRQVNCTETHSIYPHILNMHLIRSWCCFHARQKSQDIYVKQLQPKFAVSSERSAREAHITQYVIANNNIRPQWWCEKMQESSDIHHTQLLFRYEWNPIIQAKLTARDERKKSPICAVGCLNSIWLTLQSTMYNKTHIV